MMEKAVIKYKIIRETSKYNKYIKWFAKCYHSNGSLLSSFGYRTEKQARQSVLQSENPISIGDRLIQFEYKELGKNIIS